MIIESNIIMEYLEDAFPYTKRLMPKSALGKAAVRNFLQRLDTASFAYRDDQHRYRVSRPASCGP